MTEEGQLYWQAGFILILHDFETISRYFSFAVAGVFSYARDMFLTLHAWNDKTLGESSFHFGF